MLILTSYGFTSPIVAEKLKEYVECKDKKILVVPFAGFSNEKTAGREIREGLIPYGFCEENIYVCTKDTLADIVNISFDYIYVPGGNPFKLLKETQENQIRVWIKKQIERGCTYIGASSGADYCCEDLSYLKMVSDNDYDLVSFEGLGMIKKNVLCHVDQRDMGTLKRVREYNPDKKLIMLRNDEVYVINNYKDE